MLWLLINSIQLNTYSSHVYYVPGIVLGKEHKDQQTSHSKVHSLVEENMNPIITLLIVKLYIEIKDVKDSNMHL